MMAVSSLNASKETPVGDITNINQIDAKLEKNKARGFRHGGKRF
jgi:hypothetical protein